MKNGKYSINEFLEPVNNCLALKSVQMLWKIKEKKIKY